MINATIFHSTALADNPYGENSSLALNPDGIQHFASGLLSDSSFGIGIEDLSGGGDRDYNDGVFRIDIQPALVGETLPPTAFAPSLTITDDGSLLTGASVQLVAPFDAADALGLAGGWSVAGGHLLRGDGSDTGLTAALDGANLTIAGVANHATYQDALRAVALIDNGAPSVGELTARFQVFDELHQASQVGDAHLTVSSGDEGFTIVRSLPPEQPHIA